MFSLVNVSPTSGRRSVTHHHRHQQNDLIESYLHTTNSNNKMFLAELSVTKHHTHLDRTSTTTNKRILIETHVHTTHATNNEKILTEGQSHTINNKGMILTEGH